jgi:CRISPR system Cascade subunit CasE
MFLSRIELGPRATESETFWRDVSQPYGAHQALWRLFSDGSRQPRTFLFRAEQVAGKPTFLTLSEREPREDNEGLWRIDRREFRPALKPGQRLGFKLRSSPVVRRGEGTGPTKKRSKRHDVVMDGKRRAKAGGEASVDENALITAAGTTWLRRQAERCGFALCESEVDVLGDDGLLEGTPERRAALRVDGYTQHRVRRAGAASDGMPIRFSTLDFEGMLEVRDPEVFLKAVVAGFGPQKAFGCGLMLLRRG